MPWALQEGRKRRRGRSQPRTQQESISNREKAPPEHRVNPANPNVEVHASFGLRIVLHDAAQPIRWTTSVSLCQPRIIPLRYFPEKDPGRGLRCGFELRTHSRNVVHRYICAQDSWKVQDRHASLCTVFFELRVIHRSVTRSEIENARCKFSDTSAGTNSLIFNLDIWMKLLKFSDPLHVSATLWSSRRSG